MADSTSAPNYGIKLDGALKDDMKSDVQSFVIERDMFQPDMLTLVLSNQGGQYSVMKIGTDIEIFVGDDSGTSVYKGEVIGLEPIYRGGEKSRIVVRAMNKFHRLLRHRKSVTYSEQSDADILNKLLGDSGFSLQWQHDTNIKYKHVYQHNQTDMEFLRTRAARVGCHVWCVDRTVYVKQPALDQQPTVRLNLNNASSDASVPVVKSFTPRLSTANILKKVTVKGWNPEKKELITGSASAQNSKLGQKNAVAGSGDLAAEETFTVDHPIWSNEEATALAKARLVDLSLSYITGECETTLDPARTLGEIIAITANEEPDTKDKDPFNGRYYVMGVTHRFIVDSGRGGGYTTTLRLARDAQLSVDKEQAEPAAGAA